MTYGGLQRALEDGAALDDARVVEALVLGVMAGGAGTSALVGSFATNVLADGRASGFPLGSLGSWRAESIGSWIDTAGERSEPRTWATRARPTMVAAAPAETATK